MRRVSEAAGTSAWGLRTRNGRQSRGALLGPARVFVRRHVAQLVGLEKLGAVFVCVVIVRAWDASQVSSKTKQWKHFLEEGPGELVNLDKLDMMSSADPSLVERARLAEHSSICISHDDRFSSHDPTSFELIMIPAPPSPLPPRT